MNAQQPTRGTGVVALALAIAAAVAAASCTPRRQTDPDVITLAVRTSPANFDPRVGVDEVSQKVYQLVYDNLFNFDEQLGIGPGLATHFDQPDEKTYVVHLRQGVRFHDGHELTAADVVHTFGSLIAPDFVSGRKGAYTLLDRVEAVDQYTVRFSLEEPFAGFPTQLVLPVVPAGAGADLRDRPVGTGPYMLAAFAIDDRVDLAPFPGYYGGPPRNAGVTLKIVPDDIMRALELQKGTVDMVINDIEPDTVEQLRDDGGVQVIEADGTDYAYVAFNLRDRALADVRVRQAIGYAIDRNAIVNYLRRGLARPAIGIVPPMSWAYEPEVFQFTLDRQRAKQLLDEAGYRDPDGDGPQPRLQLSLKVSTAESSRLQAAVIQQDLREVGIDLDVRTYEFATLQKDILSGNFQLISQQWVGITDPDMMRRVFHSKQMPPNGFNRGFYSNPDVDRLIDEATTASDAVRRKELYAEAQRLIARDVPYVSLWIKRNVAVAQRDLTGIRLTPTAEFSFLKDVHRTSTGPAIP
jgi:peptide/nickel transport system substrate-binding protein